MDTILYARRHAQRLIDAYNEDNWNCAGLKCTGDGWVCDYCHFADYMRQASGGGKKSIHKIF